MVKSSGGNKGFTPDGETMTEAKRVMSLVMSLVMSSMTHRTKQRQKKGETRQARQACFTTGFFKEVAPKRVSTEGYCFCFDVLIFALTY